MLAVAALAIGTGAVVGVGSASAGSLVSQATAQALNVDVLGGPDVAASNPPTSATNDGTDPNTPVTVTPTVPVLSGISGLGAGALAEETEANQNGSSFSCAGVVQPGGTIQIGSGNASCTATGGTGGGVTLNLGSLPGVGSMLSAVADVTLTLNSVTAFAAQNGSSAPTLNANFTGGSVTVNLLSGRLPTVTIPLTIGSGVNANLLTTIANAISGDNILLDGVANIVSGTLSNVLDLQTNFQPAAVDGTSSVTALHVGLLGLLGASASTIDLATATVGPNVAPVPAVATNNVPAIATTGLSPISGPIAGGRTVTITGTGFTGATAVDFGSTPTTGFTVNSSTQVTAISPPLAAGGVRVTVIGPGGTSNGETFTYFAVPTISTNGINPNSGPTAGGNIVTITGTGFAAPATVNLGSGMATSVTVVSPTQITATDPAGTAGPTDVTVTDAGGTSNPVTFTYVAAPTISTNGINPDIGPTAGCAVVTITGTNFVAGADVSFGGAAATGVTVVSATEITAVAPAGAAGPLNVTVTTPGGASNPVTYTYETMAVALNSISPTSGPDLADNSITVDGSGFAAGGNATTVMFGTQAAVNFTVVSDTQITAILPAAAAGPVNVTVVTLNGASNPQTYTYVAVPAISAGGITPDSGPATGGTNVTITGTGFAGPATVSFAGNPATNVVVVSPTEITATSPAGTAGVALVTVTDPGGPSNSEDFTYDPLPTIATTNGISPNSGPTGGGTVVTVTGTGFVTGATVDFGTTAAGSPVVVDGTTITAIVPAASLAGPVNVTVSDANGTSGTFTYTYEAPPNINADGITPDTSPTPGGTI